MADLVEKLKEIGFNTYEAKVYIALLKKYPATGYEVAKLANIPQSRTYDTLKVLEEKNIVVSTNEKPQMYTPIKPKQLTARYQKKVNSTINFLDKHLQEVKDSLLQAQKKYNEWDQASSQLSDDTTGQNMKDQVEKDRAIFGNDLTDLKELEQRGVRILTCGTCLNFYGLSEKLKVGEVTNMYEIAETMSKASLIVSP